MSTLLRTAGRQVVEKLEQLDDCSSVGYYQATYCILEVCGSRMPGANASPETQERDTSLNSITSP